MDAILPEASTRAIIFFERIRLHLQDVGKLCPVLTVLIGRNHTTVMPLQEVVRRVNIEQVDQAVEGLLAQFLPLLVQAFLVFLDWEADHSIGTHEEVFTVRPGDDTILVAKFPALTA